jgi:hypothetical protein
LSWLPMAASGDVGTFWLPARPRRTRVTESHYRFATPGWAQSSQWRSHASQASAIQLGPQRRARPDRGRSEERARGRLFSGRGPRSLIPSQVCGASRADPMRSSSTPTRPAPRTRSSVNRADQRERAHAVASPPRASRSTVAEPPRCPR